MTTVPSGKMGQMELIPGATDPVPKHDIARKAKEVLAEYLPPNIARPIKAKVPDFSDPNRPHTCLEVDFPIVPINALSALEGNAGKPIYQMSKWWARRRSCVFRAMLIAAAMEAPPRKRDDGSIVLDENGVSEPDMDEAHKAVWDVYYANHQQAENFTHLKVLVVCPRNDLAVARTSPNGSSNGDSGPNRRNASQIKRQLVQGTHH